MAVMLKSLLALLLACAAAPPGLSRAEISARAGEVYVDEPPVVRSLLERADQYEQQPDEWTGEWQAAILYCEASRFGSAEGQYRLGMLYAFGKGVPESRALAASLFSVAAASGHVEAQKMLETIQMTTSELPPCVLAAVLPDQAPRPQFADASSTANIDRHIERLPENKKWLVSLVRTLADWYQVDSRLVLAVIAVESNFQVAAASPKSAMGLMQLIPETAARFNVRNAYDATQNIRGGIKYLRWLLAYYRGDVRLAVAAYNAGEKAVDRHKGVPPYAETRQYVKRVLELYESPTHPYQENITEPSPLLRKG